ncbi:MAG: hypothetical protein HY645_03250 [Acidobacteria bacterium]|nr:hypothetical protein [Acidobacteriota bacterium]
MRGKILLALDHDTIWQLFYEKNGGGIGHVYFDHRPFAQFYEGVTGQSFHEDYVFGRVRQWPVVTLLRFACLLR